MPESTAEEEFKSEFRRGLRGLEDHLVNVLRKLTSYDYPDEVVQISFEVFPDSWSDGFPARAFFMDKGNNEHFIFKNGKAEYPSPVDPGLLKVPHLISHEFQEQIVQRDPDLDTFSLGVAEFIPWFAACWKRAGGASFQLRATIADHDGDKEFNLVTGQWQERYEGF